MCIPFMYIVLQCINGIGLCATHINYYVIGLHNYFNCLVYSSNNYATEMTFL